MSGATAQDPTWKSKEHADEARHVREKEQAQLQHIRDELNSLEEEQKRVEERKEEVHEKQKKVGDRKIEAEKEREGLATAPHPQHDFEGGFGGQEDLEDRYATTSGEH